VFFWTWSANVERGREGGGEDVILVTLGACSNSLREREGFTEDVKTIFKEGISCH